MLVWGFPVVVTEGREEEKEGRSEKKMDKEE